MCEWNIILKNEKCPHRRQDLFADEEDCWSCGVRFYREGSCKKNECPLIEKKEKMIMIERKIRNLRSAMFSALLALIVVLIILFLMINRMNDVKEKIFNLEKRIELIERKVNS